MTSTLSLSTSTISTHSISSLSLSLQLPQSVTTSTAYSVSCCPLPPSLFSSSLQIVCHGKTVEEVTRHLGSLAPPFLTFRDASCGPPSYPSPSTTASQPSTRYRQYRRTSRIRQDPGIVANAIESHNVSLSPCVVYCVVDFKPYQLSCPGSPVG